MSQVFSRGFTRSTPGKHGVSVNSWVGDFKLLVSFLGLYIVWFHPVNIFALAQNQMVPTPGSTWTGSVRQAVIRLMDFR